MCHDCFVVDAEANKGRAMDYTDLTPPARYKAEADGEAPVEDPGPTGPAEPTQDTGLSDSEPDPVPGVDDAT